MIVIDSSALFAILQEEEEAERCRTALKTQRGLAMSAGTFTESLIVAAPRNLESQLIQLIETATIEIVPIDEQFGMRMAIAYRRWGKGFHPAKLNFGDCFAYVLAMDRSCPLLFVGADFAMTDVIAA